MEEPKAVQDEEQAALSKSPSSSSNTVIASRHNEEPQNPDLVSQPRQRTAKRHTLHIDLFTSLSK